MRAKAAVVACVAVVAAIVVGSAASADALRLTPVGRLAFPEKGYVLDLPANVPVQDVRASATENGRSVLGARLTPLAASGLKVASVLALDASDSMHGAPYQAALDAARTFVDQQSVKQAIGLVAFNDKAIVLHTPTHSRQALHVALSHPPELAYGTRIYDSIARSLDLLAAAKVSTASIVLLSDGTDIGSSATLDDAVNRARSRHVRIFTVGLRSSAFSRGPLEEIARRTGGTYTEASGVSELAPIFAGLSGKFTNEFVLRYRSHAVVGDRVHVVVDVGGRTATADYEARVAAPKPYHKSLLSRFFLSPASLVLFALLDALLVAFVVRAILRFRPHRSVVERVNRFIGIHAQPHEQQPVVSERELGPPLTERGSVARFVLPDRMYQRVVTAFEIGRIHVPPTIFVLATAVATFVTFFLLYVIAPPFVLLTFLVPVFARAWAVAKVQRVRNLFSDQLPDMLQLLASALRSGHSFMNAMRVAVEQSPDPIQTELTRVLVGDQIGIPAEASLREVAVRMDNRDLEQLALLSELNRTAGGNTAEVIETVVETVRERAEVRGMARTLTAQGRLSRWILTVLPPAIALFLTVTEPKIMRPLWTSTLGQTALVLTALMVVMGSFWMKKIIEVKV